MWWRVETRHPPLRALADGAARIAVHYDSATEGLTIWQSTQTPHRTRPDLARILHPSFARPRPDCAWSAPSRAAASGMKGFSYPEEILAVWAALHFRRDMRWIATRSEEFLSAGHGRGLTSRGRLALDAEGRFLALEARIEAPVGGWVSGTGLMPAFNAGRILPTGYLVPALDIETAAVAHPSPPVGIYRGAGRPEANVFDGTVGRRGGGGDGDGPDRPAQGEPAARGRPAA